jgi:LPS export ABC transporter protein LptC
MAVKLKLIRFDALLVIGMVLIVAWTYMGSGEVKEHTVLTDSPEFIFTNTNFIDVNRTHVVANSFATNGKRVDGILFTKNVVYRNDTVHYIRANNGKYDGEKLFLKGDVFVDQKKGNDYETEFAIYNTETKKIHAPQKLKTFEDNHTATGNNVTYDTKQQQVEGEEVKAIFNMVQ